MRILFVLATLVFIHVNGVWAGEPPSLARVFEGKFRFGFGGTHDKLVREGLLQPNSPIRRIVEQQSNIIGINGFYPNSIHPRADVWRRKPR